MLRLLNYKAHKVVCPLDMAYQQQVFFTMNTGSVLYFLITNVTNVKFLRILIRIYTNIFDTPGGVSITKMDNNVHYEHIKFKEN